MIHLVEPLPCSGSCGRELGEGDFKIMTMTRGATGAPVYFIYCIRCRQVMVGQAQRTEVASGW